MVLHKAQLLCPLFLFPIPTPTHHRTKPNAICIYMSFYVNVWEVPRLSNNVTRIVDLVTSTQDVHFFVLYLTRQNPIKAFCILYFCRNSLLAESYPESYPIHTPFFPGPSPKINPTFFQLFFQPQNQPNFFSTFFQLFFQPQNQPNFFSTFFQLFFNFFSTLRFLQNTGKS